MSAPASFARRACGLFLASTALFPAMAAAQDTAAGEQPAPPAVQERQNEGDEIVVTATKRAENLQDVPIAITAFATKTLEDNQVQSFDDYSKMIPSLSQQNAGPGATNVYFRGVANMKQQTMKIQVEADAKDFSLLDIDAPVEAEGKIRDPKISIGPGVPIPIIEPG